jgi:hypothetical protein
MLKFDERLCSHRYKIDHIRIHAIGNCIGSPIRPFSMAKLIGMVRRLRPSGYKRWDGRRSMEIDTIGIDLGKTV